MSQNKSYGKATLTAITLALISLLAFGGASYARYKISVTGQSNTATVDSFYSISGTGSVSTGNLADNRIAPGSGGAYTPCSITGTSHVPVTVEHSAELSFSGDWKQSDGTSVYMPLVFTVGSTTYKIQSGETLDAFKGRIEGAIAAVTNNVAGGTAPTDDLTLSWSWPLTPDTGSIYSADTADINDTYLAGLNPAPSFSLSVTTTVVQNTQ
ncbi:MAG: hypothetical protein Q4B67_06800 [Eubacteriales bacterium]|nr:hypothetical protein [Eubacteriales bacterium]